MKLTLNQAAKDCGRAKSTISKAIKTGKLSHEKGDKGAFLIDQSELHRVFPPTNNEQDKFPVANTVAEQRADFRQTLAVITDQRAVQGERRFFGLLPPKSV